MQKPKWKVLLECKVWYYEILHLSSIAGDHYGLRTISSTKEQNQVYISRAAYKHWPVDKLFCAANLNAK